MAQGLSLWPVGYMGRFKSGNLWQPLLRWREQSHWLQHRGWGGQWWSHLSEEGLGYLLRGYWIVSAGAEGTLNSACWESVPRFPVQGQAARRTSPEGGSPSQAAHPAPATASCATGCVWNSMFKPRGHSTAQGCGEPREEGAAMRLAPRAVPLCPSQLSPVTWHNLPV